MLNASGQTTEVHITGIKLQQNQVQLFWDKGLDRFIVEKFPLQGSSGNAVATSTGRFDSTSYIPLNGDVASFYRVRPGLAAVFFADPNLEAIIRQAIAPTRQGPTNWVYDVEVGSLNALTAKWSGLASLAGLSQADGMTKLDVGGNALDSVEDLRGCVALSELHLDGNQLSSLAGLESLQQLRALDISQNQLINLTPLESLSRLQVLYADRNRIVEISALEHLLQLQTVDLSGNLIRDISPLLSNAQQGGLGPGDIVYLAGNPIDQPSQVAALRGYGISVTYP